MHGRVSGCHCTDMLSLGPRALRQRVRSLARLRAIIFLDLRSAFYSARGSARSNPHTSSGLEPGTAWRTSAPCGRPAEALRQIFKDGDRRNTAAAPWASVCSRTGDRGLGECRRRCVPSMLADQEHVVFRP